MNRLGNSLVALSPELGHSTGASEKKLLIDFSSLGFSMSGSVCDLSVESIQQITDSLYDGQGYPGIVYDIPTLRARQVREVQLEGADHEDEVFQLMQNRSNDRCVTIGRRADGTRVLLRYRDSDRNTAEVQRTPRRANTLIDLTNEPIDLTIDLSRSYIRQTEETHIQSGFPPISLRLLDQSNEAIDLTVDSPRTHVPQTGETRSRWETPPITLDPSYSP